MAFQTPATDSNLTERTTDAYGNMINGYNNQFFGLSTPVMPATKQYNPSDYGYSANSPQLMQLGQGLLQNAQDKQNAANVGLLNDIQHQFRVRGIMGSGAHAKALSDLGGQMAYQNELANQQNALSVYNAGLNTNQQALSAANQGFNQDLQNRQFTLNDIMGMTNFNYGVQQNSQAAADARSAQNKSDRYGLVSGLLGAVGTYALGGGFGGGGVQQSPTAQYGGGVAGGGMAQGAQLGQYGYNPTSANMGGTLAPQNNFQYGLQY